MTFYDNQGNAAGRIDGETSSEVANDPQFIYDNLILIAEEIVAGVNVGLSALPTCVGGLFVSCGVSASSIAMAVSDLALASANLTAYNVFAFENLGVTYQSGSADYAEWLERVNPYETLSAGDIVGINSGKISKKTSNCEQFLVISTKPAILGNMPE